jgi:hypothetical protein
MGSEIDHCWAMALEYTQRAEEATDSEVREFFYRVRNSWIRAANHQEVLEGAKGIIVEPMPSFQRRRQLESSLGQLSPRSAAVAP